MAEEKQMRLLQAAKRLNVGTTTIGEVLAAAGHRIESNPNFKLNQDQLEVLAKKYNRQDLLEDSPAPKPAEAVEAPSAKASDEILYFRESPKAAEPIKEEVPVPTPAPPVVVEIPKPVELPKPEPEPIPEPVQVVEAIDIPEVKEAPVVLTPEPEKIVAKAEPEGLTIVGKIDLNPPKKEKFEPRRDGNRDGQKQNRPQNQQAPQAPKPKRREEIEVPKPIEKKEPRVIIPVGPVSTAAPEEDVEVVRAKGDALKGLTVLGTMVLPVKGGDPKDKRQRKRIKKGGSELVGKSDGSVQRPNTGTPGAPGQNRPPGSAPNAPSTSAGGGARDKGGKKGGKKDSFSDNNVKDSIKKTMATLTSKGPDFGAKHRKDKRKNRAEQEELRQMAEDEENAILKVTEFISASELATMMNVSVNQVIAACMGMGMFVSINQRLDAEQIQLIALEFNRELQFISAEDEITSEITVEEDNPDDLVDRAPIVTIMGHVDHGKTSLLDYIRRAKVAAGEAGGITQHIGAYSVKIQEGVNKGKKITFLDTPGHEAFTAMRARGAKVTDVVIIVVAADDSVMPQTREAINHAQNAGVPIVIAINKIDKDGANPAKIREDLAKENVLVESWGGKYQEQEISAKKGIGIDELLDKVLLESDLLELKGNNNRLAMGSVIEASLDKGRGYLTTILVETGTMRVGDVILAGPYFGKIRAMINDRGERLKEAGPSMPVQILGLPGAPQAGDKFNIMANEREAREIANKREQILREQSIRTRRHITLDEIGRRKAVGNFQQLNLIVKGDVDGSVEALSDSLQKLSTEEVHVNIIHKAVGQISESDVLLASAGDAIILGFQVRPSANAKKLAETEEIEVRHYSVIYAAIEEVKEAMTGLLAPKVEEVVTGNIQIREVFKISKLGNIAGCYVLDGFVKRNNKIRIIREGIVIHEGEISALKRFKDDVMEVKTGYECGLSIKGFNDIQIDDVIESFEMKETKRTL